MTMKKCEILVEIRHTRAEAENESARKKLFSDENCESNRDTYTNCEDDQLWPFLFTCADEY